MISINSSILYLWRLANREVFLSGNQDIFPLHFFIAYLYVIDGLNPLEANLIVEEVDVWKKMTSTAEELRKILNLSAEDVTRLRRSIQKRIRVNNADYDDEQYSRTPEVVKVFSRAFRKAELNNKGEIDHVDLFSELFPIEVDEEIQKIYSTRSLNSEQNNLSQSESKRPNSFDTVDNSPILAKLGRNLSLLAKEKTLRQVVGRDLEIKTLARCMLRSTKKNAILIGPAGVGKTAIVEGLANWLTSSEAPDQLKELEIIQINAADLVASTSYRGQMEQRIQDIIQEAKANPNIVLFIDEFHMISGNLYSSQSAMDIANILKPALASDSIRCIGATTADEYYRFLDSQKALMRRFQVINIEEPDTNSTILICKAYANYLMEKRNVKVSDMIIEEAVKLSDQFIKDRYQPDKAIDLIDNAVAATLMSNYSKDKITDIELTTLYQLLSDQYGVINKLQLEGKREKQLAILEQSLAYQEEAFTSIKNFLELSPSGNRPRLFIIMGGSLEVIGDFTKFITGLFTGGDDRHLCTIDFAEYINRFDSYKLFGVPPGFTGFGLPGILESQLRSFPTSIFTLNNYNLAEQSIKILFDQIFLKGKLHNQVGDIIDFSNCIFLIKYITEREELTIKNEGLITQQSLTDIQRFAEYDLRSDCGPAIFEHSTIAFIKSPDEDDYRLVFNAMIKKIIHRNQLNPDSFLADIFAENCFLYLKNKSKNPLQFCMYIIDEIEEPTKKLINKGADRRHLKACWGTESIIINQ